MTGVLPVTLRAVVRDVENFSRKFFMTGVLLATLRAIARDFLSFVFKG
ncbi:hypothetical protein [Pectobacterium sp. B1J-3]